MKQKKRILICPLDWGLGHATRCIPIIRELMAHGAEIIIGADKAPLSLLKNEFPENEFVVMPGYEILYPSNGNMSFQVLKQIPKILGSIKKEHNLLAQIIKERKIDAVISDNRYGLWTKKVPTVFITHQLMIKCPGFLSFFEYFLYKMHLKFINKFSFCWIPDIKNGENISGDLSHKYSSPMNARFIGPLSRFLGGEFIPHAHAPKNKLMIIISGPEPQRTIFEKMILEQLSGVTLKTLVIRGLPGSTERLKEIENVTIKNHLPANEMYEAISNSEFIISRPGYSSIMDFVVLGKNAAFIPTPGQTEQEYLAKYYKSKEIYNYQEQKDFNLLELLKSSAGYTGLKITPDQKILSDAIKTFLDQA